mgnify:CR=1 FL=1
MESWVSLGKKEGRTNIRISVKPRIEPEIFWGEYMQRSFQVGQPRRPFLPRQLFTNYLRSLRAKGLIILVSPN